MPGRPVRVVRDHLRRHELRRDEPLGEGHGPAGSGLAESGQTLQISFSAVSKPNFASEYSLESSRRDLHNALLCTVLKAQIVLFEKSLKILQNFCKQFARFC